MTFSEHLLQLRKTKGLSQPEIAAAVGISWRGYQNYELGLREPKLSTPIALAASSSIPLNELVCREWSKEEEHA